MVQCYPILSPHTGRDLVDSAHAKTLFKRNNSTRDYFGSTFFPVRFKWALKLYRKCFYRINKGDTLTLTCALVGLVYNTLVFNQYYFVSCRFFEK